MNNIVAIVDALRFVPNVNMCTEGTGITDYDLMLFDSDTSEFNLDWPDKKKRRTDKSSVSFIAEHNFCPKLGVDISNMRMTGAGLFGKRLTLHTNG